MAELTPHVAEARRAAALTVWAACAGGTAEEACALMQLASDLWPEPPLTIGPGGPLADSPSAKAWTNAREALERAQRSQGARMNIDWEQRAEAERLIDVALGKGLEHLG